MTHRNVQNALQTKTKMNIKCAKLYPKTKEEIKIINYTNDKSMHGLLAIFH